MKKLFSNLVAASRQSAVIFVGTLSLLTSAPAACASVTYSVTNDLTSPFTFFYWTNNAGPYTFTLTNTLVPGEGTNITVAYTNGVAGIGVQSTNATAYILVPWTNLPVVWTWGSGLFNAALVTLQPPIETVPQIQSVLKSYFITGAIPSQADYWEMLDTLFWYVNAMATNAFATAQSAASIANNAGSEPYQGMVSVFVNQSTSAYIVTNYGMSCILNYQGYYTGGHNSLYLTNTFNSPIPDQRYTYQLAASQLYSGNFTITEPVHTATNSVLFVVWNYSGPTNLTVYYLR